MEIRIVRSFSIFNLFGLSFSTFDNLSRTPDIMVCSFCHKESPKGHNIRTCPVFQQHYKKQLAMIVLDVDIKDIIKNILLSLAVPGIKIFFAVNDAYQAYCDISAATRVTQTQLKAEIVVKCAEIAKNYVS